MRSWLLHQVNINHFVKKIYETDMIFCGSAIFLGAALGPLVPGTNVFIVDFFFQ